MSQPENSHMPAVGLGWMLFCVYLAIAVSVLYYPISLASGLLVSDATEYAIALHGRFEVVLGQHVLPSRYPPGFPLFFLAPIALLAPQARLEARCAHATEAPSTAR